MSVNELSNQIDSISNNLTNLVGKLTFIPTPINIPDIDFPDDRVILKYSLINGNPPVSEEDAHMIVYGHNDINSNEVIEDKAIPVEHPQIKKIKNDKKDVKIALEQLKNKGGELVSAATLLTIQIGSSAATIGSSAIILPPGAGLPTAFSALMSIFSSLESFLPKLNDILPILDKIKILPTLLPNKPGSPNPDIIVLPIVTALSTINVLLGTLDQTAGKVSSIKNLIPVPSGGVDLNGNKTSPEPIEIEIKSELKSNGKFKLKSIPSKGSWKYKIYKWSTSDPNESLEYSNTDTIIVRPQISDGTIYKCEVIDDEKNRGENSIILLPR